jgi:hypothetical protein
MELLGHYDKGDPGKELIIRIFAKYSEELMQRMETIRP